MFNNLFIITERLMTDMDNRSKAELELIAALENDHKVSQTALAKRLGIAAGLVNILMKRAVNRGFVKMTQIPARRYAYYLTPTGFAEKAKLVMRYLDNSLNLYRKLRVEYRDIFNALEAKGVCEVVLVGDEDIGEIAIMASFDTNITIKTLVNPASNKKKIGPVPVTNTLSKNYSRIVVICDVRSPQSCFDELAKEINTNNIFYPDILFIFNQNVLSEDEVA